MTKLTRVKNFIVAILMIFIGLVILIAPDESFIFVCLFISISVLAYAIKELYFYFTMAMNMVGGIQVLYKGCLCLYAGFILTSFYEMPKAAIFIYLLALLIFSNVVDILAALDSKKVGDKSWKLKFLFGLLGMALAVICIMNYKSTTIVTQMYAINLIYSAIVRIVKSCRKTAIVYIQ